MKHRGGRLHGFGIFCAGELERRLGRRREEGEEPVELVGKRGEGGHRAGRASRAVLDAEETPPESVDRSACEARAFGPGLAVGVEEVGNGTQRAGGLALEVGSLTRRPEQHQRANPGACRQPPTFQALRDRRVRRRQRYRQDKRQEGAGRGRREVAVDDAREERRKADDRHRTSREPCVSRAERPERDERGSDAREPEVRHQTSPRRPRELDENEQRERAEGREERGLRLPDYLVRESEHRRHDDRRACRVLDCGAVPDGAGLSAQELDALGRRRATRLINQDGAMLSPTPMLGETEALRTSIGTNRSRTRPSRRLRAGFARRRTEAHRRRPPLHRWRKRSDARCRALAHPRSWAAPC
jgi:hypothetical protein